MVCLLDFQQVNQHVQTWRSQLAARLVYGSRTLNGMNAWHDDVALVYWKLATNAFCFLEAKEPQPSLTLNGLDALSVVPKANNC